MPPDLHEWIERYGGYINIDWAAWDLAVVPWADAYLEPTWISPGFRVLQFTGKALYDGRWYMKPGAQLWISNARYVVDISSTELRLRCISS